MTLTNTKDTKVSQGIFKGDIVKFNEQVVHETGKWCFERGITGKVIHIDNGGHLTIQTALPCLIWVLPSQIDLVAKIRDFPELGDIGD